jgi:biotin carboxyl carrier protein
MAKQNNQKGSSYHTNNNNSRINSKKRFKMLDIDGTKYRTLLTEKFKNRKKWDPLYNGKIYSEFPGNVVQVDVSEGDYVSKGDRLYIYEAMKMKNRAYSPVEGKLKEVRIQENDIIRKGQLLFIVE